MAAKKILYLHIGTHKTGTTSIQAYLWNNRRSLREQGLDFPEVGLSGSTHADFVNCQNFPHRTAAMKHLMPDFDPESSPYKLGETKTKEELFAQLGQYVENSNCSKFVMSSECFFEWTEPQKFSDGFQSIFDEISIVVYLRSQSDWIISTYNQLIKDSYFKYTGDISELPQIQLLKFFDILEQWEQAFGKGSVVARPYVAGQGFNVVLDLLTVMGIQYSTDKLGPVEHVHENKGIPMQYVDMIKHFNTFPVANEHRDKLVQLLQTQVNDSGRYEEVRAKVEVLLADAGIDSDNAKLFEYFSQEIIPG